LFVYEWRDEPDEVYRRLAYDLHRFWGENDQRIQSLFVAFRVAALAVVAEIVLLLASVSETLV